MVEMEGRSPEFVASLAKGLNVIRAFDAQTPALTLSEVAERTGLSRAAARRFLLTLSELGFAESDGKRFRLTPKVLELGYSYLSSLGLTEVLTPILSRLSEDLKESVSAAVLDGIEVVYIARVQAHRILSVGLGVGDRLPAFATSMGRVLLAHAPDGIQRKALDPDQLRKFTDKTIVDAPTLMAILRQVRDDGYCLVDQELEVGLRSLAVPLRDVHGQVRAALNVSGHASRTTVDGMLEQYLPVMRKTAAEISVLVPQTAGPR
ncbi:MAG TPA: IclR family transcriptional regulator C-terminal domain-containing protein [Myxococcales bacterium LLY-WYZ-16_1]|nr:IclR family transcriptional regulator C-terminal domain-containing protein [Myxococcales bacterium LLY-WYZ-16_1]